MAQADGVVANGTGAAVRADLNDQLAAVFTNHSGSSEPATTYAYQWWADTTANVLKIRNSANNAWITLRELDGTMLIEDGSASTPGLSFASDTDSGLFGGSDTIGFATGGNERLEIGSSEVVFNDPSNDVDFRVESNGQTHMLFVDAGNDRVGIGASAPENHLHIKASSGYAELRLEGASSAGGTLLFYEGSTKRADIFADPSSNIVFRNTSESARIDSSGRLLVGTSTSRIVEDHAGNGPTGRIQIEATDSDAIVSIISAGTSDANRCGTLSLGRHRNSTVGGTPTVVQDGDSLGAICFAGGDGTDMRTKGAKIVAEADGGPGSNDMPGRIILATTADGGVNPTERVRIDRAGSVGIDFTPKRMHSNVTSSLNVGSSSLFQRTNNSFITSNFYYNSSDVGKSIASGYGVMYSHNTADGRHNFNVSAASAGSADATHSLQTKVIIDNDGLKFNGDTAAANALDDYEEGDWTPSFLSGGWTGGTLLAAKYVKIGAQVFVQMAIESLTGTGNTAVFKISSLPFNSITNGYSVGSADIGEGSVKGVYARTESNSNQITFFYPSENVSAGRLQLVGNQIGDAYIIVSLTYFTAS